jgi:radical SAM superfamily enzyme YgiQ (UPF0313 family)
MNILENLPEQRMRIWVLQPNDPPFIWYHDLWLAYLLGTLIDTVKMNIYNIGVNYVLFTENCLENFKKEMKNYPEEYFLFFMEDFFHSADYARKFIEEILQTLLEENIEKKIIVFSHKTELEEANEMMKKFKNITIFVHDDVEYFFHAYFSEWKSLHEIPNILYRENEVISYWINQDIVDTDLADYIHGAYYNGYYSHFPRSKDTTIRLLDVDDKYKSIHLEMRQPKNILKDFVRNGQEYMTLSTGRGCRYNCSYCYRWAKYSKVRKIPLETIEKDLEYIVSMGYTYLQFYDDCFLTTNIDRIDELVLLLKKYPLKYHISIRFEMCSVKNLELLQQLDIASIQIWLQSTGLESNKTSKRGFQEEKFEKVITALKNQGVKIHIDTILGLPDDSVKWFIETIKFAIALKPTSIVTNTLYLNPRTELYKKQDTYGIKTMEAGWALKYYKTKIIQESDSFRSSDIEFCKKFLIACKTNIHSIRFIIR